MNWYIGQDIVAIKTHSKGAFKEGDIFTIKSLMPHYCYKCGGTLIDIGIKGIDNIGEYYQCPKGHGIPYLCDGIWWFSEKCFRPLDELADISELTEVFEEPVFN